MVSRKKIHTIASVEIEPKIIFAKKSNQNTLQQKYSFAIYLRSWLKKNIINSFVCLTLIFFLFFNGVKNVAYAKELIAPILIDQSDTCIPVDLVFVIDQSKDMLKDDPHGMRVETIKWLFNFLGFDRLLACPDSIHRVALISFNNQSSVQLELTSIKPEPTSVASWTDWESQYSQLIAPVQEINTQVRNSESLQGALKLAANMLSDAPDIGIGQRKKAIILIIGGDGAPCSEGENCAYYLMDQAQKDIKKQLDDSLDSDSSLWVLTYRSNNNNEDEDDGNLYNKYSFDEFWEDKTKQYQGKFYPNLNSKGEIAIGRAMMDIFLSLSPRSDVEDVCGTLYIDPFLDKVGFNLLLEKPEKDVRFQSEIGNSSEQVTGGALASSGQGAKLLYTTSTGSPLKTLYYLYGYPVPGRWEVSADCNNNKALVFAQFARSKRISIVEPLEPLPQYEEDSRLFDPEFPYYLKVQVEDIQGVAIREYQPYQADTVGKLIAPDGKEYELIFHYEDGLYISNEPLSVNKIGDYIVRIDLRAPFADPNLQGQYIQNLHFEGKYTVAPITPFALQLETPTSSSHVSVHGNLFDHWLKPRPIDVKVRLQLRSSNDNLDSLDQILRSDPSKTIKIILYYPASQSTEEAWLEPSATDPLLFVGKVGGDVVSPGSYSLKTSFEGKYDSEKYRLALNPAGERVEFKRGDGLFEAPLFYYFLLFFLAIIGLWFAWQEIWKRTNIAKGYLLFIPPGQDMKPFVVLELTEQNRRRVVYDQETLRAKSWLLSNLVSITTDSSKLIGGKQKFILVEKKVDKEEIKEMLVEKEIENITLVTTSVEYKIQYSTFPPQSD